MSAEVKHFTCVRTVQLQKDGYEGLKGTEDENEDAEYLKCVVTFSVDHAISLLGIRFSSEIFTNPECMCDEERHPPGKDAYEEEAFVYLLDGSLELTKAHIEATVKYGSEIEAMFAEPHICAKNKVYRLRVFCNVDGAYPAAECANQVLTQGVKFNFKVGKPSDSCRDSIIRALLFKKI